jgi:hypothetical protein
LRESFEAHSAELEDEIVVLSADLAAKSRAAEGLQADAAVFGREIRQVAYDKHILMRENTVLRERVTALQTDLRISTEKITELQQDASMRMGPLLKETAASLTAKEAELAVGHCIVFSLWGPRADFVAHRQHDSGCTMQSTRRPTCASSCAWPC